MQAIELDLDTSDYGMREAYKTLRTNIGLSGEEIQTICITSSVSGEGKSTTALELAVSFAEDGRKTLLIDADLRKSALAGLVRSGEVKYGLAELLQDKVGEGECICATNVPGLSVLFSGAVPSNPSELLGSAGFGGLLEGAKGSYDMIVIDTPPLGLVIDAAVVAKQCDGAILVIKAGAVAQRFAKRVSKQLTDTGCPILGCVLNKVDLSDRKYYGRHYE